MPTVRPVELLLEPSPWSTILPTPPSDESTSDSNVGGAVIVGEDVAEDFLDDPPFPPAGLRDGPVDGIEVAAAVGLRLGRDVGGMRTGDFVGPLLGRCEGINDGAVVDGLNEGRVVGIPVGLKVGGLDGGCVGTIGA